jgi:Protein of unknown function (DUF4056)
MILRVRLHACTLLALAALVGCVHAPAWMVQRAVTAEDVARVLDEPAATERPLTPSDIPAIPMRKGLRPCCAFGAKLGASVGPVPVPFFSLSNIVGLDQVGPHTYDAEPFSTSASSKLDAFMRENNALLYTCRGGFIDLAHVRDNGDMTLFWSAAIARASLGGATIELPNEGGARRVHLRPLPPDLVARYGLRRVAISVAQWLAFELSVWHEIATTYGWSTLELYPEYLSAFSPEDLYSNLLGIKIAGGLLMNQGEAETDVLYGRHMDEWLRATLAYLQPVSADAGAEAMRLVDGVWWDSRARLPDPRLVLRRNTDAGAELSPWVVSRAYASPAMQAWVDRHCGGAEHPLTLRRGSAIDGHAFEEFATLEIDVHVPDPFPFPRAGSTRITHEDFPVVLQAVRRYAIERLGPDALRPERSAE